MVFLCCFFSVFLMVCLCFSHGCLMVVRRVFLCFPTVVPCFLNVLFFMFLHWFSNGFPMDFLRFSPWFPLGFLCFFAHGCPMVFHWGFQCFSHACRMVSNGFPMLFTWFSNGFLMFSMIFSWYSNVMLCYAMLCDVMHVMLCYVMPCHVMSTVVHGFPMVFSMYFVKWVSHGFVMRFPLFFQVVFLCVSYGLSMVCFSFPMFFNGCPMIFFWFHMVV